MVWRTPGEKHEKEDELNIKKKTKKQKTDTIIMHICIYIHLCIYRYIYIYTYIYMYM